MSETDSHAIWRSIRSVGTGRYWYALGQAFAQRLTRRVPSPKRHRRARAESLEPRHLLAAAVDSLVDSPQAPVSFIDFAAATSSGSASACGSPAILLNTPSSVNEQQIAQLTGWALGDCLGTLQIDWGDGSQQSLSVSVGSFSITHTYADDDPSGTSSDLYGISATLRNTAGSQASASTSIRVYNSPPSISGLSLSSSSINENDMATLSGSFSDPGTQDDHTVFIDWGDNSTTSFAAAGTSFSGASHRYLDDGSYTIAVTVSDDDGGSSTSSRTISVANVTPQVSLSASPSSLSEGQQVTLGGSISDPGSLDSHWVDIDWGDGGYDGRTSFAGATHRYLNDGTYTVRVTVWDDGGSGTASRTVSVANVTPQVLFSASPSSLNEGAQVTLDGWFYDPGSDDNHTVEINWGDGATESSTSFDGYTHRYLDDGNYTVTVTVWDDDGSGRASRSVSVANVAPQINSLNLSASSINENEFVTISGSFYDQGSLDGHSVSIDWGDNTGRVITPSGSSFSGISHRYLDDGTYTIAVTVSDDDGGSDTSSRTVSVANVTPQVMLSASPSSLNEGAQVTLDGWIYDPGTADSHTVEINWGDGATESGISFDGYTHRYLDDGNYTVTVTVWDDDASGTASRSVSVANVAPQINSVSLIESVIDENGSATLSGSFSDPGTQDDHDVVIDWGDNNQTTFTPTGTSFSGISHPYLDDGTYTISVTVSDRDGGSDVDAITLTVQSVAIEITSLSLASNSISEYGTVNLGGTFSDALDGQIVRIDWDDGSQETTFPGFGTSFSDKTHPYLDDGDYLITVTVDNGQGGSTSQEIPVTVTNVAPRITSLSLAASSIDENGTALLSGSFYDPNANDNHTVYIDWGDNSGTESVTPTSGMSFSDVPHTYRDDGNYTISVTVNDGDDSSGTEREYITVNNVRPQIQSLQLTESSISEGSSATLSGFFSDPGSLDGHTLQIDWGDGSAVETVPLSGRSFANRSHPYLDNDIYTITVTVIDDDGGQHSDDIALSVSNVAPQITSLDLVSSSISEGSSATLSGLFSDPGLGDSHTLLIDWDDGSEVGTVPLSGRSFANQTHPYLDDGVYTISVTVLDDDGDQQRDEITITVNNVAPQIVLSVSPSSLDEGDRVTLNGWFYDPGTDDTHAVDINWGDGETESGTSFDGASHRYLNEGFYEITVTVSDDDGYDTAPTGVWVYNVAPQVLVSLDSTSVSESGVVTLTVDYSDAGTLDEHDLFVDWGDGTTQSTAVNSSPVLLTHRYADDNPTATGSDTITIQAKVTDDYFASGVASTTLTLTNSDPELSLVASDHVKAGETYTLSGSLTDLGIHALDPNNPADTAETHDLQIDWGDGSSEMIDYDSLIYDVANQRASFEVTHLYDDISPFVLDYFDISVTASDDDTGMDIETLSVAVIDDPDLDADSNNDGTIDSLDDAIEAVARGRLILVNDDDDDRSGERDWAESPVPEEDDLALIQLDALAGRIVDDGQTWTIALAAASGSSLVQVWDSRTKDNQVTLPASWAIGTVPTTLYVEGIGLGNAELELSLLRNGAEIASDMIAVGAVERVDLDIDSDNNNGFAEPDRSQAEDDLEELQGKRITANTGDKDGDGIPDYADGYDLDGIPSNDDLNANERFTPIIVEVPDWVSPTESTLTFVYSESPPAAVGLAPDYVLPEGHFRIWSDIGNNPRSAQSVPLGHRIEADREYSLADLELNPGESKTLFVEAVHAEAQLVSALVQGDGGGGALVIPGIGDVNRPELVVVILNGVEILPPEPEFPPPEQDSRIINVDTATFDTVNDAPDSCTLRAAMMEANQDPERNLIHFGIEMDDQGEQEGAFVVNSTEDFPDNNLGDGVCTTGEPIGVYKEDGVYTIRPGLVELLEVPAALPDIKATVTIDGTTQKGYQGTPVIQIDGSSVDADGFTIKGDADESVIKALTINRFRGSGIVIESDENKIESNFIGTNHDGSKPKANGADGIRIHGGANNIIGSEEGEAGNLISGNESNGIVITGDDAKWNKVFGNKIGSNVQGDLPVANGLNGILITEKASENEIGNDSKTVSNLISGNIENGVEIRGELTNLNHVFNNVIGMNQAGNVELPNWLAGVSIHSGAQQNKVEMNLISGNTQDGVSIKGQETNKNVVINNKIGTNADGTLGRANVWNGVSISEGAQLNRVDSNTISGNTLNGVRIADPSTDKNTVINNKIGSDPGGQFAVANFQNGVFIGLGATQNTIDNNTISGNKLDGVVIRDEGTEKNTVKNNEIGTKTGGNEKLANLQHGVEILAKATSNTVQNNLISGNGFYGVVISGSGTNKNTLTANTIGANKQGGKPLANTSGGVAVSFGAAENTIGEDTDGKPDNTEGNLISGNNGSGVVMYGAAVANEVKGNLIGSDVSGAGRLPNAGHGVFLLFGPRNNEFQGNVISANVAHGVWMFGTGTDDNNIAGNWIGVDLSGGQRLGNGGSGVALQWGPKRNQIHGNVISDNGWQGVYLYGIGTEDNVVAGNAIGTDQSGQAAMENAQDGVSILGGAKKNLIGTDGDGNGDLMEGNVISGNQRHGVLISGPGTDENIVAGNKIGTNIDGTKLLEGELSNVVSGVVISEGAKSNKIQDWNVISGNGEEGVLITGKGTDSNIVSGNKIGTNFDGTGKLNGDKSNGANGVLISDGAQFNSIENGNVISGNVVNGIHIKDAETTENSVSGNYIGTNAGGTAKLSGEWSNGGNGVLISDGAYANVIEGANVISGNDENGVRITGEGTHENIVTFFNVIGADVDGEIKVANGVDGVRIDDQARANIIELDNLISGNTENGVHILGDQTGDNIVRGNLIGTKADGTSPLGNDQDGVRIAEQAQTNHIRENVVSGNRLRGIRITGSQTDENTATGNKIGTDKTGQERVPNREGGVLITAGARANTIGGSSASDRNTISGNEGNGIQIGEPGETGPTENVVAGNYIGTKIDGQSKLANTADGVLITDGAFSNRIENGNAISGNEDNGIHIKGENTTDNVVSGNHIGTNEDGTSKLSGDESNGDSGVLISDGAYLNRIENGNVISGNEDNGVHIKGAANSNIVSGNYIGTNDTDDKIANGADGVRIEDGAQANMIEQGNIISGNTDNGVHIFGEGTEGNIIRDNLIGTKANGTDPLENGEDGVRIRMNAKSNEVKDNLISGNRHRGVRIAGVGTQGNTVRGNTIGADQTGMKRLPNQEGGVLITFGAKANTIGGTSDVDRNTISGNEGNGVQIGELGATAPSENVVAGNYIGTKIDGETRLENTSNGVLISHKATLNRVESGNVISGNKENGILITGSSAANNRVSSSFIGTNRDGILPLANTKDGVHLADGAHDNYIGSDSDLNNDESEGNVISGNQLNGIHIIDFNTTGNKISGNQIGTQPDGKTELGNSKHGVLIEKGASNNLIGSERDGTDPRDKFGGNVIAYNGSGFENRLQGHGIMVNLGFLKSSGNAIRLNSIFANTGRGIDLGGDSFTLNSVEGDIEFGANNLQDYPIVVKVDFSEGVRKITWALDSSKNEEFDIQFFSNDTYHESGFGDGKKFLRQITEKTNKDGYVEFTESFPLTEEYISATATDSDGNTSEFSIVDTDGDALADAWEVTGIDIDEDGTIDLELPNGDPNHKTVYVEVDGMMGQSPVHLRDIVAAYAAAPAELVQNPDGARGIHLEILLDETTQPSATWNANPWPEFDEFKKNQWGTADERANANWANIDRAKRLVYRYAVFANSFGTGETTGVGEATLESEYLRGGNDLFIALGSVNEGNGATEQQKQASFMHELGHTLGLRHGGGDNDNYKPNYHSVMNYTWLTEQSWGPWMYTYSKQRLPDLDENNLDETAGIGGSPNVMVGIKGLNWRVVREGGPVDWNENTDPTDTGVMADLNGDGEHTVLHGFEDWSNLRYYWQEFANAVDGIHPQGGLAQLDHPNHDSDDQNLKVEHEQRVYAKQLTSVPFDVIGFLPIDTDDSNSKVDIRRRSNDLLPGQRGRGNRWYVGWATNDAESVQDRNSDRRNGVDASVDVLRDVRESWRDDEFDTFDDLVELLAREQLL